MGGGSHLEGLCMNRPRVQEAPTGSDLRGICQEVLGEVPRGMCKDVSEGHSWTLSQDNAGAGSPSKMAP